MKDYMSIPEFYKRFPTELACHDFIVAERWNGKGNYIFKLAD